MQMPADGRRCALLPSSGAEGDRELPLDQSWKSNYVSLAGQNKHGKLNWAEAAYERSETDFLC